MKSLLLSKHYFKWYTRHLSSDIQWFRTENYPRITKTGTSGDIGRNKHGMFYHERIITFLISKPLVKIVTYLINPRDDYFQITRRKWPQATGSPTKIFSLIVPLHLIRSKTHFSFPWIQASQRQVVSTILGLSWRTSHRFVIFSMTNSVR